MNGHSKRLDYKTLENQLSHMAGELGDAMLYQADLEAENRRLTSELEELKDELDLARGVLDHPDMERAIHKLGTVPRVITADELKEGQLIAVGHSDYWRTIHLLGAVQYAPKAEVYDFYGIYPSDTIVLLEDAPTERPSPVKVGDTVSTVGRLGELPDKAIILDAEGDAWSRNWGAWYPIGESGAHSSQEIMEFAPFTVLYLPEEDA